MRAKRIRSILAAGLLCTVAAPASVIADDSVDLAPYAMLRSLQFVQDTVVQGDHSAGEMQRFMLATLDKRLRTANASVFEDPRNVDAAMIYAMSGGNPATLEYLASRDVAGHFDSRVADGLRKYLSGKGNLAAKNLAEMAEEYRDQKIGPYLALVSGNVAVSRDPKAALVHYDWARLTAPGTIIEEAALRRSVAIAVEANMVPEGLLYSRQYARRFVHSPYASQFADFFVDLVVGHFGQITEADIDGTVEFMDVDRRREVFLRIARAAAIRGNAALARLASAKAEALAGNPSDTPGSMARLYGGVADISTSAVGSAMDAISAIPEENLSERDRALLQAAKAVASQVIAKPEADSLAQESPVNLDDTTQAGSSSASTGNEIAGTSPNANDPVAGSQASFDPAFKTFVDGGRSKLDALDELLKEETASP
ncbi:chemotaxis protein MotC [Rhizobium sp. NFR07]|uniref:chemotaxis protein MotC n=1 Tax=Rhizobium sp. NFR07 TaxID=1566262 RepID=UPI0008EAFB9F|nr:chemotaxis protein MotC [Rhizobium sp. NFR07]SFB10058.1 chemotaxis protein MotC [Rhizobium sp. NFR07]